MQLYIDNKKVKLKNKKYNSLGGAINEITNELKKHNKIPYKFYINGKILEENDIIDIKDLKFIEVLTRSHTQLLLDAILKAKKQIHTFLEKYENKLSQTTEPIVIAIDEVELIEQIMFFRWFYKVLLLLNESNAIDNRKGEFQTYLKNFKEQMNNSEKAIEKQDYESFIFILTISMISLFNYFLDNVDDFFKTIIAVENSKRLLN